MGHTLCFLKFPISYHGDNNALMLKVLVTSVELVTGPSTTDKSFQWSELPFLILMTLY